ncbi:hypothetical protein [Conyzicola sp.]|uniref:hypothetical protein n=1 Tax=Conyzicola sp. TaxID=1969404 RepID=UPI0039898B85
MTRLDESHVVAPLTLRALRYIRMLEAQSVYCTFEDLTAFVRTASPAVSLRDNFEDDAHDDLMTTHHYVVVNTVEKYLTDVGWIESTSRGVELTKLGRAVAASADGESLQSASRTVVNIALEGSDPLTYSQFLIALQRTGRGIDMMLIDPYLPSAHVPLLLDDAGVTHILTADNPVHDSDESATVRRKNFGLALGARASDRFGIRLAKKGNLHDRLVLPTEGTGLMIGRSLGGKQLTAVVELNDSMTSLLRAHYAPIWDAAKPVSPADLSHVRGSAPAT